MPFAYFGTRETSGDVAEMLTTRSASVFLMPERQPCQHFTNITEDSELYSGRSEEPLHPPSLSHEIINAAPG